MKKNASMICARALLLGAASFALPASGAPAAIEKAVGDSARPATDTGRDADRKPAELVAFAGIRPGMKVVDLLPGGGYFTRIFARTVGPKGWVYAYEGNGGDARMRQQGKDPDNQHADLKMAYPNVGVIHGPLTQFVTPEPVDLVWTSDNYHDLHIGAGAADIPAMNKAIYASLRKGGVFMVVDYRAAKGAGLDAAKALHRMDEDIAKKEIEAAGFRLASESRILTRPADDSSKRIFEAGEHDRSDQMVLKFVKP